MSLKGKGYWIWKIPSCENGDANAIANVAAAAGLTHLLIKIADGTNSYNIDSTGVDLVPPVIAAAHKKSIVCWGWQYVYGYDPIGEANKAIQRITQLGLDGYVIDAEAEYKQPGKSTAATTFMNQLRASLPNLPIALSSYRYPSYHPQFPWTAFLEKCDLNMPQVYWELNHNPGEQLIRSVNEFQSLVPFRPIVPAGAAYKSGTWAVTAADATEFLQTARSLNLEAANFWEWSNTRIYLPEVWKAISAYSWPVVPPPPDIAQQYIQALNTHDPNQVIALYGPSAVHVNSSRTIQGLTALRSWYNTFLGQVLPNATFHLTGYSGVGSTRHVTWTATSSLGSVNDGNDTLGIINDRIAYHYSFFSIKK